MSYCRFSSMDWKCDLYVYYSDQGIVIDIAANRIVGDLPKLVWPSSEADDPDGKELFESHKAQMAALAKAERAAITLPHAGAQFVEDDERDAVDRLRELRALGYIFPDEVLDELLAEWTEPDEQQTPQPSA